MEELSPGMLAALVGLGGGLVFGLAARLGDFCTLGALEAAAYGNDQRRLRLWDRGTRSGLGVTAGAWSRQTAVGG